MEIWLDTIASASLVVSGRFHHTIAAAVLGIPFIIIRE
jgi:polysaccharide pyruvyl transferase WcaK-like protein